MNAGCSGWCTELRICQDITRLESAEANWRTGDPERRLLATFSWRQTRPAAQCWQTSWGRGGSPCSGWTPCKTALWGWSCLVYSRCSAGWCFCCWFGKLASRAQWHSPCTHREHRCFHSLLSCNWPLVDRSTWSTRWEIFGAGTVKTSHSCQLPDRWRDPSCRWFWCICTQSPWTASQETSGPDSDGEGPLSRNREIFPTESRSHFVYSAVRDGPKNSRRTALLVSWFRLTLFSCSCQVHFVKTVQGQPLQLGRG